MAEISRITLPSGTTYDIKDANARERIAALESFTTYLGVTTTDIKTDNTANPIKINGNNVTAQSGNIALYGNGEFIFDGTYWDEFGDLSALGTLAYKNSATGSITPAGSVSQPSFTGTATESTGTYKPKGNITISTGSGTANYTPAGSVSQPTFTGTSGSVSVSGTPSGSVAISTGSGTANYTPAGNCTGANVTLNTTDVYSITDVGSLPTCTLPEYTVQNEVLSISGGSFNAGSLPTKSSKQTVATGVKNVTQPTFTGTGVELKGAFTGNSLTSTGNFTPSGTVSQPSFTGTGAELKGSFNGTEETVSVTGTPSGTVSKPTFSGTAGSVTVS